MTYWRMHLYPMEPEAALRHTVKCLAANFLGIGIPVTLGVLAPVALGALANAAANIGTGIASSHYSGGGGGGSFGFGTW